MGNNTQITPAIDLTVLQEKANQAAMKGAMETIEDFYCKWNSPYRKAIEEDLQKKEVNYSFDLPNIVALVNEKIVAEIDKITNKAVAETFIPLIRSLAKIEDKEIKFSKILTEFIEANYAHKDEYKCEVREDEGYSWLKIILTADKKEYSFNLHQTLESKKSKDSVKKYHLLSLPEAHGNSYNALGETMELSIGEATLKIPFRRDAINNPFSAFMARLIIGDCEITMDAEDFEEDMFDDHCHC